MISTRKNPLARMLGIGEAPNPAAAHVLRATVETKYTALKARRESALPAWMQKTLLETDRERRCKAATEPMRLLFDALATGEVYEIGGIPSVRIPVTNEVTQRTELRWVVISYAVRGWAAFWAEMAPRLPVARLHYLADRLESDKPLTPRLVAQAREEFDACVEHMATLPPNEIRRAMLHKNLKWELRREMSEGLADTEHAA